MTDFTDNKKISTNTNRENMTNMNNQSTPNRPLINMSEL